MKRYIGLLLGIMLSLLCSCGVANQSVDYSVESNKNLAPQIVLDDYGCPVTDENGNVMMTYVDVTTVVMTDSDGNTVTDKNGKIVMGTTMTSYDNIDYTTVTPEKEEDIEFKALYGEYLEIHDMGDYLVIKAEVSGGWNNQSTINLNYYNVEHIICDEGGDRFDSIQYWAVAENTLGDTIKYISFEIPSNVIKAIKDGKIPANQMGKYVDDLYILPSLLEE